MSKRYVRCLALAAIAACAPGVFAQQAAPPAVGVPTLGPRPTEPRSPIQTTLAFRGDVVPGQAAVLVFTVTLDKSVPETAVAVDFRLPERVSLLAGLPATGVVLRAGDVREFPVTVTLDGAGSLEITASAIGGDENYRFGQRRTLYITVEDGKATVSDRRPVGQEMTGDVQVLAPDSREVIAVNPAGAALPPPPPGGPETTTDPDGQPLADDEGGFSQRASCTVYGYWRYRHDDTTLHGGYGTQVFFWDDDTASADDLIGSAVCDGAGFFSLTFDNADPEGGTADVYLEFRTYNGAVDIHSNAGTGAWYTGFTGVLFSNIGAGSFDAGSWYYDTGTPGIADGIERAYEVTDYMSRAWAHANYNLGYGPHYTYVQWYDGSLDGSYYDPPTNMIHLDGLDFSSPDVLMHEFGHSLMESVYAEVPIPGAGGPHSFTGHYNTALAWSEGWATWFSCSAQGNDLIYNSYDPDNLITFNCESNWDGNGSANGNSDNLSNNPNWGYDTESAVLSFLLDLDDGSNDPTDLYDWTSLADNEIWDVTANHDPAGANPHVYGIQQFYDGWFARGWAYHPQLNGQMLVHGMNQGISKPVLGLYSGVSLYGGTWYYGGYGRGSYDVKNYGSQNYDLNQCYVWLRGPAGQDIGQFGGDGDGSVVPARTTRNVWVTADQTGYNPGAPNFIYGTYSITAGHYRSDNAWQLLEPAEPGTVQVNYVGVVQDTDAPDYCYAYDDGAAVHSPTQLHVLAYASDYDSSIRSYWTRVGTSPYAGDTQDWVDHLANNQTTFDYTITGLTTSPNTVYYITIVARNIEGYDTWAVTDGIITSDATPPGPVTVTDDGYFSLPLNSLHFNATSSEPDGAIMGYWTRVGTLPGYGDQQDWVFHPTGDIDVFDYTITGLSMVTKRTYYITVVARNVSGSDTWGYSDGIIAGIGTFHW